MSELMTPEDCRYYANGLRQHGCPERAAEWERAAATIEALQAQLAERPSASVDTDEAREALDDLLQHAEGHLEGGYYDDDLFGKAAVEADRLCRPALDALDASRAEFEKLRKPLVDLYTEWCNRSDEAADEGFSFDGYWLGKLQEALMEGGVVDAWSGEPWEAGE